MTKEELLKMKKELSGYASIDKPWADFYNSEELNKNLPSLTVYQEVYENNKDYLDSIVLEFFHSKINYGKLFNQIDATAKSFEEYGVKEGNFVTICATGVPEAVYSFYGLSKLGAVSNMIAPYFDKTELTYRINDCESKTLVVMDIFYDEIKNSIKNSGIKNIIVLPTLNSSILKYASKKYKIESGSELSWNQFIKDGKNREESKTIAYKKDMPLSMVYSSGTTGASKGILLSNDSFLNSIRAYPASGVDITRGQKFYQIIPFWFSTGLSTSLLLPTRYGCTVYMDPRFERQTFVKNILKAKPNYTVAPTSMYEGFLDEKLVKNKNLSFFNYPFEGGEPLREEVAKKIENVFKEHGSDAKLRVAYGQCEAGGAITTQTQQSEHSNGSVGIPIPGVTIAIVDEDFNEQKYHERGQIITNTPCSMLEYYKNESATDEYFYYDKNGLKWNCTGDIGYIDETGNLFVQGRKTDYSIINGKKIYNFDIENILMNIKSIKMCDVLGKNFEEDETMVAHIIFDENLVNINDSNELMMELERIQDIIYQETEDIDMVPYIFKIRDSFPYAKSGKRDVGKLMEEEQGFTILSKYKAGLKKELFVK